MASVGAPPSKVVITSETGGACYQSESNPLLLEPLDLDKLAIDPLLAIRPALLLIAGYAGEIIIGGDEDPPTHCAAHEIALVFYISQVIAQHMNHPASLIFTALLNTACKIIVDNNKSAKSIHDKLIDQPVLAGEALEGAIGEVIRVCPSDLFLSALNSSATNSALYSTIERFMMSIDAANESFQFGSSLPLSEKLEMLLGKHKRVVVAFSGGKESVVIAHMLNEYRDKVELVWVNTGAAFPHMQSFIHGYRSRFKVVELRSDQDARFAQAGLPSLVVPLSHAPIRGRENKGKLLINDWITCCYQLRTQPILGYIQQTAATLLIHGQRHEDRAFFNPGNELKGVDVLAPLKDWTEARVMDYIERNKLELPEQYPAVMDSLECWNCTASLSVERFEYMRQRHPELLERVKPAIGAVYSAVADEMGNYAMAIRTALE
jgi:3'-phosphoadenosine 5'-phosphosulfate sulfotransferase (PAPS reductase)/FAD synthetase